jgi:ribosomal protein S18 acetylase RimI-like enzyme
MIPAIRRATAEDIDEVLALWADAAEVATITDTRASLARLISTDPGALLLAELYGQLAGTLIAAFDGWRGSFYRLVVRPNLRRRGIATALMRAGEQRLLELDAVRLTAIVDWNDPVALSFWTGRGYESQPDRIRFVYTPSVSVLRWTEDASVVHGSVRCQGASRTSPQPAPRSNRPRPSGSRAISPGESVRWRCVW